MKSIPATDLTDITLLHILNKQPATKTQELLMFVFVSVCVFRENRWHRQREMSCSIIYVVSTEDSDISVSQTGNVVFW